MVARPKQPLITRQRAAREALNVIDIHGLEKFSMNMVARRMGVRDSSIYHHFSDKADLLAEASRLVLLNLDIPEDSAMTWEERYISLAVATRQSILRHPNIAPLLIQLLPRRILLSGYERFLSDCPLPSVLHMTLLEGIEKLAFGSALFEAASRSAGIDPMPHIDRDKYPLLAEAIRSNPFDLEELFVETIKRFYAGLCT